MAFDPALTALALSDDAVFLRELIGGLLERLFGLEETCARFAAQLEIPVLSDGLGNREVFLLCATAPLFAANGGRAPPIAAIATPIELNLAAKNAVIGLQRHGRTRYPPGLKGDSRQMC